MKIGVLISGCDDSTWFVLDDVTEAQREVLVRVAEQSKRISVYGCMPTVELMEGDALEKEDAWRKS